MIRFRKRDFLNMFVSFRVLAQVIFSHVNDDDSVISNNLNVMRGDHTICRKKLIMMMLMMGMIE